MSSIVIAGDTSGTVTLQAPAVAGSTVLNLPTLSGGTLVTSDSAGNVGIGVTPSAWLSTRTAVELKSPGSGVVGISNGNVQLTSNIYTNTSGVNVYGINGSGVIAICGATSGEFNIFTAPPGTAGATATLTPVLVVENGGNLKFNSGYGSIATAYGCRAWVNFNGTANTNLTGTYSQTGTTVTVTITGHGYVTGSSAALDFTTGTAVDGTYIVTVTDANTFTVTQASRTTSGNVTSFRNTIRASGNVSSITDNGTGNYTVNFTTAMPDANYGFSGMSGLQTTESTGNYLGGITTWDAATKTTTAFQFQTSRAQNSGSAGAIGPILIDTAHISLQFFR
jgi:hypothetical protein